MADRYSTPYQALSDVELHSLFSTGRWAGLSLQNKLDACQEVENRYAAANNVPPCRVECEVMTGGCYGYQLNGTITLNQTMLSGGFFRVEDLDEENNVIIVHQQQEAANWKMLETVYHEGTHGIQESQGRMAISYVDPEVEYDIYRIQGDEREAFARGQLNTLNAIDAVQKSGGEIDPQTRSYINSVKEDSYQSHLLSAAIHYNDPDIEQTVDQVIYDRDHGLREEDPSDSYTAVNNACIVSDILARTKENGMDWEDGAELNTDYDRGACAGYDGGSGERYESASTSGYDAGRDGGMSQA